MDMKQKRRNNMPLNYDCFEMNVWGTSLHGAYINQPFKFTSKVITISGTDSYSG